MIPDLWWSTTKMAQPAHWIRAPISGRSQDSDVIASLFGELFWTSWCLLQNCNDNINQGLNINWFYMTIDTTGTLYGSTSVFPLSKIQLIYSSSVVVYICPTLDWTASHKVKMCTCDTWSMVEVGTQLAHCTGAPVLGLTQVGSPWHTCPLS